MDDLSIEPLVDSFYAAGNLRQFDECERILTVLAAQSDAQPAVADWHTYLKGLLLAQRDLDLAGAERLYSQALASPAAPPLLQARILIGLAMSAWRQGRWADAIETARRSLPILQDLNRPIDQASALRYMAINYRRGFEAGDFGPDRLEEAVNVCQQALAILENSHDTSPRAQQIHAVTWNSLGLLYRTLGRWDEAIRCFERYLAVGQARGDTETIGYAYGNLGTIYTLMGPAHWPQALESLQLALSHIRAGDDPLEEIEALANLAHLHALRGAPDAGLAHYLEAIDLIEQVRVSTTSEETRAGFFATVSDTYANAILLAFDHARPTLAFELAEHARSRALLDQLTTGSSELPKEFEAHPLTLEQVQAALPPRSVLIAYFTTGQIDPTGRGATGRATAWRHRFPPSRTLGFAVTRTELHVFDANFSPNDLTPRQLSQALERYLLRESARKLQYEHFIAPVETLLRGVTRLYITPHGPLHYLPFAAFLRGDGQTLLTTDGPELVLGHGASVLFRQSMADNHDSAGSRSPASLRCLALGYNGDGQSLRFTEEEAERVAILTDGTALAGSQPKKAQLLATATDYDLLHFSCHGVYDPVAPLQSFLQLAPDEILSALDVLSDVHLRCRLVTLSACESGLSRVRRGDELMGLVRAFMVAGAPAVIATLWRVDERSTRLLMEDFYRQLMAGDHPAAALKTAQLRLRANPAYTDPFYWAPFILVGRPD